MLGRNTLPVSELRKGRMTNAKRELKPGNALNLATKDVQLCDIVPRDRMNFYARRLGPKLKALLAEAEDAFKPNDISQEIALTRTVGLQAVALLNGLMELEPSEKLNAVQLASMTAEAGSAVVTAMDQSSKIVERAAKIYALTSDKIAPTAIDDVVKQICRFVYVCFEANIDHGEGWEEVDAIIKKVMLERIQRFDQMLSEELELPSMLSANAINKRGTTITTDQQVRAMIDTVPFCEDETDTNNS